MLGTLLIGATRFLLGGQTRWTGTKPASRQRIYFANHSSNLDTLVLWAGLPAALRRQCRPVAAADYWDVDPVRRHIASNVLNAVLIERGAGIAALDPVQEALRDGDSLIVFPEGTRHRGLLPERFRSGLFHLAREFPQVELVPVYLNNLHRSMPKGVFLPVPVSATVIFGTPLRLQTGEDKNAFLTRARAAIVDLARTLHPQAAETGGADNA